MRTRSLVLALWVASCTSVQQLELPVGTDDQSILLVTEPAGGLRIEAFDLDRLETVFSITTDDQLLVLAYPHALAELRLEEGVLLASSDDDTRPIPSGYIATALRGENLTDRRDMTPSEVDAIIGSFRIADVASGLCENAGGCFLFSGSTEHCALPCPVTVEVKAPDPPEPPKPPIFRPCPPGWAEELVDDLEVCGPPPDLNCPTGAVQLIDTCTAVAGTCPVGSFADGIPASALHVDPQAVSGDGSAGSPFSTFAEAVEAASDGETIALAKGVYAESPITIAKSLAVVGACAETRLEMGITVTASISLERMTLTSVNVASTGLFTISDAQFQQLQDQAVAIEVSGQLTASRIHLEGTHGILLRAGGQAIVRTARFDNTFQAAIHSDEAGVRLDASDLWIDDPQPRDGLVEDGYGLHFWRGADLTLERVIVRRPHFHAIAIWGDQAPSQAKLTEIYIDGEGAMQSGQGIDIAWDTQVTIERARIREIRRPGLWLFGAPEVTASDLLTESCMNAGVWVNGDDGSLNLERAEIRGSLGFGVFVRRSSASLTDVEVRNTKLSVEDPPRLSSYVMTSSYHGDGVVSLSSELSLTRIQVHSNQATGIYGAMDGPDPSILIGTDITVADITDRDEPSSGIRTDWDASIDFERVAIEDVSIGLLVRENLPSTLTSLKISRADGGLVICDSNATIHRASVGQTERVGLFAFGSHVQMTESLIYENRANEVLSYCDPGTQESGAIVATGTSRASDSPRKSSVELADVIVENNDGAGVLLDNFAELDTLNVDIRHNTIGLDVLQPLYPLGRLKNTALRNNEIQVRFSFE